eukprot:scaffold5865_cov84-Skeletonema_dohrnii-CCMP3373.AAC.6
MPLLIRHGRGSKEGNRSERSIVIVSANLTDMAICNLLRMLLDTRSINEHILTVFLGLKQSFNTRPIAHRMETQPTLLSLDCWGSAQCINNKPNTVHSTAQISPQILTSLHP